MVENGDGTRSWAAMPPLGWAQIIAFIGLLDSRAIQSGLPDSLPHPRNPA